MSTPEFHLYLPQMRLAMDVMVEKARAAEAAGFTGMAGMDHLAPPMAEQHDMYEALTTNAWLLAHTDRLVQGQLVLCDAFRRPSGCSPREAVTLDPRRVAASSSASAGARWSRSSRRTACNRSRRASASAA